MVETDTGERVLCHPRGKKNAAVVGDRVRWQAHTDEGTIESVEPRTSLFYRQDELRTKTFAANLDQVLVMLGAEPEFSEHQLSRALIAAEAARYDTPSAQGTLTEMVAWEKGLPAPRWYDRNDTKVLSALFRARVLHLPPTQE